MHALRNIHAALVPGAMLVDTQPVGAQPSVAADGAELGTLDLREWLETIKAVDERIAETLAAVGAGEATSLDAVMAADAESRRAAGTRVAGFAPALSS